MAINSRNKGKKGELELAHILKEHGYDARRSQQFAGMNGDADVVGLEGIHIECKRVENLNLNKAMEQAIRDAKDYDRPCVFHRKNRDFWKVTMTLEDFLEMYRREREYLRMMWEAEHETKWN
jgi:Holliday junction resolvase